MVFQDFEKIIADRLGEKHESRTMIDLYYYVCDAVAELTDYSDIDDILGNVNNPCMLVSGSRGDLAKLTERISWVGQLTENDDEINDDCKADDNRYIYLDPDSSEAYLYADITGNFKGAMRDVAAFCKKNGCTFTVRESKANEYYDDYLIEWTVNKDGIFPNPDNYMKIMTKQIDDLLGSLAWAASIGCDFTVDEFNTVFGNISEG